MFRIALMLGFLAAIGPFAIDMYLPALPAIAQDFDASVATIQVTLTAFFVAFGLSQLVYGPWADQAGRKPPLYAGLTVFIIGSAGLPDGAKRGMACGFALCAGTWRCGGDGGAARHHPRPAHRQ